MSYVKDNLMPNEKILFSAKVSGAIFFQSIFLFIVTLVFFIIGASLQDQSSVMVFCLGSLFLFFCLLEALSAFIHRATTEFAVTNRRVIAKSGFIRRHTLEMLISKIESVAVNQHVIGRIFNFGNVTVIGTGGTKESFRAIAQPIEVRKKINQIIEDYQQAYALHQQQKATTTIGD
jgi:uncharacterized membrane protein YdbT with pleckstrin-like domain